MGLKNRASLNFTNDPMNKLESNDVFDNNENECISIEDNPEESKNSFEKLTDEFGEFLVKLPKGYMFGELALLNSQSRLATIVTNEECKCITMDKKQFDHIKKYFSKEMVYKKEFMFNVLPKLDDINADKYVIDILNNFANIGFTKGYIVTKQDEIGEKIFF